MWPDGCHGVEALGVQEIVFNELVVGVVAERLMIDYALLGVWTDHDPGDPQAVAVLIGTRWRDVVVEATPVIPREKDRGVLPGWTLHDRVDQPGHVGLPGADQP